MQIVHRRWKKSERGAKFANKRSSLPWVYPLDAPNHEVQTRIFEGEAIEKGVLTSYKGHELSFDEGSLFINVLKGSGYRSGATADLRIVANKWIQLIGNFREVDFSSQTGYWYFGEYRLNIGLFNARAEDAFCIVKPHKVCDLRRHINSVKPYK